VGGISSSSSVLSAAWVFPLSGLPSPTIQYPLPSSPPPAQTILNRGNNTLSTRFPQTSRANLTAPAQPSETGKVNPIFPTSRPDITWQVESNQMWYQSQAFIIALAITLSVVFLTIILAIAACWRRSSSGEASLKLQDLPTDENSGRAPTADMGRSSTATPTVPQAASMNRTAGPHSPTENSHPMYAQQPVHSMNRNPQQQQHYGQPAPPTMNRYEQSGQRMDGHSGPVTDQRRFQSPSQPLNQKPSAPMNQKSSVPLNQNLSTAPQPPTMMNNKRLNPQDPNAINPKMIPPPVAPTKDLTAGVEVVPPPMVDSSGTTSGSTSQGTDTATYQGQAGLSVPLFLCYRYNLDFRIKKELTKSGGGIIYLADALTPATSLFGNELIVKESKRQLMNVEDLAQFHSEIAIMYFFKDHPNIVKLIGYTEKPYTILLKYYKNYSLFHFMKKGKRKTKRMLMGFILNIAHAVQAFHTNGIVHSDLKPENVLLEVDKKGNITCVVTDFGVSRVITRQILNITGFIPSSVVGASMSYAAPELLRGGSNQNSPREAFAADIYSLSIIIFTLINRRKAWK
jgi:hypothetical protein